MLRNFEVIAASPRQGGGGNFSLLRTVAQLESTVGWNMPGDGCRCSRSSFTMYRQVKNGFLGIIVFVFVCVYSVCVFCVHVCRFV